MQFVFEEIGCNTDHVMMGGQSENSVWWDEVTIIRHIAEERTEVIEKPE